MKYRIQQNRRRPKNPLNRVDAWDRQRSTPYIYGIRGLAEIVTVAAIPSDH
jgi:hypothetical protein